MVKKRILLIEDEDLLRNLMTMYLKKVESDWEIYAFGDAESVLDFLNEHDNDIDLMIVDIKLPNKNGVELVEEIKESSRNIPAIFITGYVNEPILEKIKEEKILLKPFQPENLIKTIKETIEA